MLTRLLRAFSADATGELYVLRHDGYSLGVDRTEICVLEKTNQVGFACFLQGHHSGALEAELSLEILGDLTDKSLEWKLADEKLSGLLVTTDLTKSDSTRSVSVWLLDTT